MKLIDQNKLTSICSKLYIVIPDKQPDLRVGNHPTFISGPIRTIDVAIVTADSREYLLKLFETILSIEKSWYVFPRVIYNSDILLGSIRLDNQIIYATSSERKILCAFLVDYLIRLKEFAYDLFLVGSSGKTLVDLDHHIFSDGLRVYSNDVKKTNLLLHRLNDLGTELCLYYDDAPKENTGGTH